MSIFNPYPSTPSSTTPAIPTPSSANTDHIDRIINYVEKLAKLEKGMESIEKVIYIHTRDLKDIEKEVSAIQKKLNETPWLEQTATKITMQVLISLITILITYFVLPNITNVYTDIETLKKEVQTLKEQVTTKELNKKQ